MKAALPLLLLLITSDLLHAADVQVTVKKTAEKVMVDGFTTADWEGMTFPDSQQRDIAAAIQKRMNALDIDLPALVRSGLLKRVSGAKFGATTQLQVEITWYAVEAPFHAESLFGVAGVLAAGEPTIRPLMKLKGRLVNAAGKVIASEGADTDFKQPALPARKLRDYFQQAEPLRSDWAKVADAAAAELVSELSGKPSDGGEKSKSGGTTSAKRSKG